MRWQRALGMLLTMAALGGCVSAGGGGAAGSARPSGTAPASVGGGGAVPASGAGIAPPVGSGAPAPVAAEGSAAGAGTQGGTNAPEAGAAGATAGTGATGAGGAGASSVGAGATGAASGASGAGAGAPGTAVGASAGGDGAAVGGAPAAAPRVPLSPPVAIKMANQAATAQAATYVALERGYFREEGLDVSLETFDVFERSIPSLAAGQVDVAGGGVSSGMFSAIARGLPIKIVAGISRNQPGFSSSALMVRKELIDGGAVREYADLRGLRLGLSSATSGLAAELHRVLQAGGLSEADVDVKLLPFPDMAIALANGAVDGGMLTEPFVARTVQAGVATRWRGADAIYPDHQITAMLFGPDFPARNPEAAVRFLLAYVRGAREYTRIMTSGDRTPIYQILAEYTPIKDLDWYALMQPSGIHPDAALNVASLEADQDLWVSQGHIPQKADLARAVDLSYLQAALQRLDGTR